MADLVPPRWLAAAKQGLPVTFRDMNDEQSGRSQRVRHHPKRLLVIGDLDETLDSGDGVVGGLAEVSGQVCPHELDVGDAAEGRSAACLLEQVWPRVGADDLPAWIAFSEGFGEQAVAATGVEYAELAASGEALERLDRQFEPQSPCRSEQDDSILERGSESRAEAHRHEA